MTTPSSEKTAILLINLGTPDAPTPPAVRRYLKEFLSDPRVVEIPRVFWWPILHGIILTTRPKQSAAKYASIWTPEGSPLKLHTERQTALLREQLHADLIVEYAMRYGNPAIPDTLRKLKQQNCQRILLLPLYPQYAASTTATAYDAVFDEIKRWRNQPELRTLKHFHTHQGYISASANNIRDYWNQHGKPEQLVMSFHGLPQKSIAAGDPYFHECQETGLLIAQHLGLDQTQYRITFQSRFGHAAWLQPYTVATLKQLGSERVRRVDVVCPGFVADCLETLEEIAMEVRDEFLRAGGGEYRYIPCLNQRPDWIAALAQIAQDNLSGWPISADATSQ
jgi:ferrochelatase